MKKWLAIICLIASANVFAILPQLVAGGASTWTHTGLMVEGVYGVSSIAGPVILTIIGSGVVSLAVAELMNQYWYTDCVQQLACDVAKLNTYAGAVAGTIITALLASFAGATTLIAIPILTATIAGGISYWWFEIES
jgi:hypothetical protein